MSVSAQPPKVGEINFYGLRKLPPDKILSVLDLKSGDPLPASKGDLEDRLELLPGVAAAHVEAVCCEGPDAILFIGIEERGAAHFDTRQPPPGTVTLPEDIMAAYQEYVGAVEVAAQIGTAGEDLTSGESHMFDAAARPLEERFTALALDRMELLRDVLRNGADAGERAVAAAVIGYAPGKEEVIKDLQFALQDAEPAVRANAVRALMAIAVFSQKHPDRGLRIESTWMVEMLNSLVLSDRQQAARALVALSERRDPATLGLIRTRALPALVEMARWKTLGFALPAFLLVGRTAGVPETELLEQWKRGDRETAIELATAPPAKARRGK